MLGTLLIVLLAGAAPEAKLKLAAPGLQAVNVPADVAVFCNDHLSQELGRHGLRVISPSEVSALLGMERQRQLLGCGDQGSCLAELAGALGADGVVVGNLGRFGQSYQLDLKIVSTTNGALLASHSVRIKGDDEMLDAMAAAAVSLASQLGLGAPPMPRRKLVGFVTGGVGLAALAVGGVLLIPVLNTSAQIDGLARTPQNVATAQQLAQSGRPLEVTAWTLLGVGGAALITGLVLVLTSGDAQAMASWIPTTSGGGLAFTWSAW